jgi:hypothetical protein
MNTSINFKKWDLNTCTPADFTVQIKLRKQFYDSYLLEKNNKENFPSF